MIFLQCNYMPNRQSPSGLNIQEMLTDSPHNILAGWTIAQKICLHVQVDILFCFLPKIDLKSYTIHRHEPIHMAFGVTMKELILSDCIVIGFVNYGESDRIVKLFSSERGLISTIANVYEVTNTNGLGF